MRPLVVLFLLVACDTPIPEGVYVCETAQDCPGGWICATDNRCYSHADDAGADTGSDAETPADSGSPGFSGPFEQCNILAGDATTCEEGLQCIQYSGGGHLICRVPCDTDSECSVHGAHSVCARQFLAETMSYCTWDCTPGTSEGCVGDEVCRLSQFPGRSDVNRDCTPTGTAGLRDACETHFDCTAGLGCVNLDGTRECLAICDASSSSSCPVGDRCSELTAGYGYCVPD